MDRDRKRIQFFIIGLLLLSQVFLTFGAGCRTAEADDKTGERPTVKIGFIFPLTGPMASFGQDMAQAIPLLEKKFNAEQSKYNFNLLLEDGKFGQSNAAITAAKKLVEVDGVHFLVVGSSGEILQISSFVETSKTIAVAGFASHPDIRKSGDFIFRTYIDAERGIELVADDLKKKGVEKIAVISEETSPTIAINNSLKKFLGAKIILSETFAFGDSDYHALIAKCRADHPQVYYLNVATPGNYISLVNQLRANGVNEQFYTYYTPSLLDVQQALGAKLTGTIYLDFPATSESSADFISFLKEYEDSTKQPPRAAFNFRTNYNAAKVIFDGIVAAGLDATAVKNFLYSYDQPSATGRLRFDENGDVKDLNLVLKTY